MDFSKLDQTDRTAAIAAAVVVVAGLIAAFTYTTYVWTWLAIIAAIGMLFVVFQPQMAPSAKLPAPKGTLMLALGGFAAVIMLLSFLINLGFVFLQFGLPDLLYLVTVAAAVAMGWAGWQAYQAGGGSIATAPTSAPAESASPPPAPPAASPDAAPPIDSAPATPSRVEDPAPAADEPASFGGGSTLDEPPTRDEERTPGA